MKEVTFIEQVSRRTVDPNGKFLLLPRRIDGYIRFNYCEFQNFSEVKDKLLGILGTLECEGEWLLNLYQVPNNYKLYWSEETFRHYPNRGKIVLTHSYMNLPIVDIKYYKDSMELFGCVQRSNTERLLFERTVIKFSWKS